MMTLDERLVKTAVVGAAGKMGRGIALLLAAEVTRSRLQAGAGSPPRSLYLMDADPGALAGLMSYLQTQLPRLAEKSAARLVELYRLAGRPLTTEAVPAAFTEDALASIKTGTSLDPAGECHLVFEAASEKMELKAAIFSRLRELCPAGTFFFTNTSSIPIRVINEEAKLDGRILGFHFYNPPAVQQLVELITLPDADAAMQAQAMELAVRLKKTVVPSRDVAGFIGNGFFLRDGLQGIRLARDLENQWGWTAAVYLVNRVTRDWLLRPMGIFQLVDYVGVDVFVSISRTMARYLPDPSLLEPFLEKLLEAGIRGGQNTDGSQKNGLLAYENNKISGIYDYSAGLYRLLDTTGWCRDLDDRLGSFPDGYLPWKQLLTDPERSGKLEHYFQWLRTGSGLGAELARPYLARSRQTGQELVQNGVAASAEDVNRVMCSGFYHLYGPVHNWL